MDIQLPLAALLPPRPEIKGLTQLIAQLKPGQQIEVVVESQIGENDYLLRLHENGMQLRARTPQDLQTGQSLTLRVEETGETPKLKILAQSVPVDPQTETIKQATRAFLPKQVALQSLATVLEHALPSRPTETPSPLPAPVQTGLRELAQMLPKPQQLATAEGLKRAIEQSGMFFEARLAAASPAVMPQLVQTDFKSRLMALVSVVQRELRDTEADPSADGKAPNLDAAPEYALPRPAPLAPSVPRPTTPDALPRQANVPQGPADTQPQPRVLNQSPPVVVDGKPPAQPKLQAESPSVPLSDGGNVQSDVPVPLRPPSPQSVDDDAASLVLIELAAPEVDVAPPTDDSVPPNSQPLPNKSPVTSDRTAVLAETAQEPVSPRTSAFDDQHSNPKLAQAPGLPMDAVVPADTHELKALLHKTEGALASVVLSQLASLPQSDDRQSLWQVDIPYVNQSGADVAKLKVVREGKHRGEGGHSFWSVNLEIHPPGLGTLNARITLINGNIDSYFWSDSSETTQLITSHLDLLAARLQNAGLSIGRLDTLTEPPSQPSEVALGEVGRGLLDEQA